MPESVRDNLAAHALGGVHQVIPWTSGGPGPTSLRAPPMRVAAEASTRGWAPQSPSTSPRQGRSRYQPSGAGLATPVSPTATALPGGFVQARRSAGGVRPLVALRALIP
jgi:hypothetical protein